MGDAGCSLIHAEKASAGPHFPGGQAVAPLGREAPLSGCFWQWPLLWQWGLPSLAPGNVWTCGFGGYSEQYSGLLTGIFLYGLPILTEMTARKPGYPRYGREMSVASGANSQNANQTSIAT